MYAPLESDKAGMGYVPVPAARQGEERIMEFEIEDDY